MEAGGIGAVADGGGGPGGVRTVAGEPLRRLLAVSLSLAVIALVMVFIAVVRAPELSIVDEPAHVGYAYSIARGRIPARGTPIPTRVKYEWYCHDLAGAAPAPSGVAAPAADGAGCAASFDAAGFQPDAQEYTFGDPPLYYLITGDLDRVLDHVVPGDHFISLGRALGAGWLLAGMLVFYLALRRFRIAWPYALAGAALLPLCPGILASTTEVTSDAPAVLAGAAALYVLARITVEKRLGFLLPFAVTVLATGTKVLNGMPMLVVGGITGCMAIAALARRDRHAAVKPAAISLAVAAGFAGVYVGWSVFQDHRGDPGWVNPNLGNGQPLTGSKAGDLLSNLFGTFQHLTTNYWLGPQINGESVVIWATLLCVLLTAAPLMAMTASRARSWAWMLGLGTFLGISAVALVVEAQVYAADTEYFVNVAARYALSFLPWAIVCLALVAHRRRLLRSSTAFVGLGLAVMLLAEIGLFTLGPALASNARFLIG